ncbi:uncharacterized protein LOC143188350 [Calliopsis andreniformis]|uniref:uncharacterized protein LOC143188350 n=1 Tax=Calliopsis andreniformis TaxID=337506 RepID=UPI003FCEA24E
MFALYHLDVYVTQLTLNKETYTDTGGASLLAKVVFLNFPVLEVTERSRYHKNEVNDIYVFEFHGGQTFHFSMPCEELVKKMKKVPLNIGVFRIDDCFPICYVRTFLNGCACDLGTLRVEKPKPFVFRGPFDLVDPGNSFAGQMALEITITNMGRYVITHYALAPNCFLYKTEPDGEENLCTYKETSKEMNGINGSFGLNLTNIEETPKKLDMTSPGDVIRDIAGISPAAENLARGRPPPKPPREPLVDPSAEKKTKKGKKGKKKKGK